MKKRILSLSGIMALALLLSASLTAHDAPVPAPRTGGFEAATTTFFNPQCKRCHFCPTRSESADAAVILDATARFLAEDPAL